MTKAQIDTLHGLACDQNDTDCGRFIRRAILQMIKEHKQMIDALEVFWRIAKLMEPLNLRDDRPLIKCLPGEWPVMKDVRIAEKAYDKASGSTTER